jgi:hypothetical protein
LRGSSIDSCCPFWDAATILLSCSELMPSFFSRQPPELWFGARRCLQFRMTEHLLLHQSPWLALEPVPSVARLPALPPLPSRWGSTSTPARLGTPCSNPATPARATVGRWAILVRGVRRCGRETGLAYRRRRCEWR